MFSCIFNAYQEYNKTRSFLWIAFKMPEDRRSLARTVTCLLS